MKEKAIFKSHGERLEQELESDWYSMRVVVWNLRAQIANRCISYNNYGRMVSIQAKTTWNISKAVYKIYSSSLHKTWKRNK